METNSRPLVLFHDQCPDGIVAAWIVWRRYFEKADYVPVRYGDAPPDCTDRLVFIVDFAFPPEVLTKVADQATRVVCIDHHATAIDRYKDWKPRHDVVLLFDIEHSGAQLTSRYFSATARMWIVDYVEDRDLWKWQLPDSKEVNALIGAQVLGRPPLEAFRRLEDLRGESMKSAVSQGKGAQLQIEAYARQLAGEAQRVNFAGYPNIPFVNCARPFTSEVLHELGKTALFAVSWRQEGDSAVFSLRSTGDKPFNVRQIAERFKGGGHPAAAGFTLPFDAPVSWSEVFDDEESIFPRASTARLGGRRR